MGGSGGVFSRSKPEEIQERIRREQEQSEDKHFETDVSAFLNDLLAKHNSRDVEAINRHLDAIMSALKENIERKIEMRFGGSIDKHTYVDGISDVDALVMLRDEDIAKEPPLSVLSEFAKILSRRFPDTEVEIGKLAVTVRFSDRHEIQLLPAARVGGTFKIPASDGAKWARIAPERFANKLSEVNSTNSGKVVPTIKLVKAINDTLSKSYQLTGYHVESLAIEAFKSYSGKKNTKAMLRHFFEEAAKRVSSPIVDRTGQSLNVDDYLGRANSSKRVAVAREMDRIARRIKNADAAHSLGQWKSVFGDLP